MSTGSTLLCIHRDPGQLSLLAEQGYHLVTANNGHEGLGLFMSRPVDAIVLEYYLGLLDGVAIANEIKQVRPEVPIVMLTDDVELPGDAWKSVDALVTRTDGPHFLLATVRFVLSATSTYRHKAAPITQRADTSPAARKVSGRSTSSTRRFSPGGNG